jgi:hypothetical protein
MTCFTEDFDRFGAEGVEILSTSVGSTGSLGEFKNKLKIRVDPAGDFNRHIFPQLRPQAGGLRAPGRDYQAQQSIVYLRAPRAL